MAGSARMARGCSLHPPARRSMEREHRKQSLRRFPVPSVNLAIRGRAHTSRSRLIAGTALPNAAGLPTGRVILARVEHRVRVWSEMTDAPAFLELRDLPPRSRSTSFLSHPSLLEPQRDSWEAVPYTGWPRSRGTAVTGHRRT